MDDDRKRERDGYVREIEEWRERLKELERRIR